MKLHHFYMLSYVCIFSHFCNPSTVILLFLPSTNFNFGSGALQSCGLFVAFSRWRGCKTQKCDPHARWGAFFLCSPCCVGVPILLFSTPLRRDCLKNLFSEHFHIIHLVLYFLLIMAAECGGTFCDELRKCASRPAWGSHFGSRCSVGE